MPARGIDASWEFAMNEGVERNMSFGRDIVFTYGPYASIVTRTYSPATDERMMWGSLLFAGSYIAALQFLSEGKKRRIILLLLVFLATSKSTEILLLSYSFLLTVCVLKKLNSSDLNKASVINWRQGLAAVLMWSTLGLLPLIKGSLLLPYLASVAISSALLLRFSLFRQAILTVSIPIAATVVLWSLAGQSLANLPAYFRGTIELTSGYTEAMSTAWGVLPKVAGDGLVLTFLTVSAVMFRSISRAPQLSVGSRWLLLILFAVILLVAFKHGFIATAAIYSTFSSFAVLLVIISFIYIDRSLAWSLSIVMFLTVATSIERDVVLVEEVHARFGVGAAWSGNQRGDILKFCTARAIQAYSRTTYKSTWGTYRDAWEGLRIRADRGNGLPAQFLKAKADMKRERPLPKLNGTADFYEYDQSALLASDNEWNPRPVIQSYSAYTPTLAMLNEQHLRGPSAPEWVLFQLQSLDGRLPSLDDGLSWPALLDNYSFVSFNDEVLLMRKDPIVHPSSKYDWIYTETCKTGAVVNLPNADGLLFAEVELKPTFAGRLAIALLNPPQLRIELGLRDGTSRSYRVVSKMMTTGFLVSPLVSNTEEVASLLDGSKLQDKSPRVDSIVIAPSYGGSAFWSGTYTLALKRYVRQ
jgi:hypothetical protein